MFTDMSEIVRPTRDGIHGREYISTAVDIGRRVPFLAFEGDRLLSRVPPMITTEIPFLLDLPPRRLQGENLLLDIYLQVAEETETLAFWRASALRGRASPYLVPAGSLEELQELPLSQFRMVELEGAEPAEAEELKARFPELIVALRTPYLEPREVEEWVREGAEVIHLCADYHGNTPYGFVREALKQIHLHLVDAGIREEVTLLHSGGIGRAEHVPKAIICGADAVALDVVPLFALQGIPEECRDPETARIRLPAQLEVNWGRRRIRNLLASWRDQLLEVLGAMGMREVRRLRGELGRAMFLEDLEKEAFAGIEGWPG